MLPTLLGRWQTRIMLFIWIGIPITLAYALWLGSGSSLHAVKLLGLSVDMRPFQILCLLLLVGLVLDPVYFLVQQFRWDNDWPFAFQFFFSIVEFLIVLGLIWLNVLPFMRARTIPNATDYFYFALHFGLVFVPSFIALLGFVQIFMVRWRFKGGEWGRL
jgi:hypothetical protein